MWWGARGTSEKGRKKNLETGVRERRYPNKYEDNNNDGACYAWNRLELIRPPSSFVSFYPGSLSFFLPFRCPPHPIPSSLPWSSPWLLKSLDSTVRELGSMAVLILPFLLRVPRPLVDPPPPSSPSEPLPSSFLLVCPVRARAFCSTLETLPMPRSFISLLFSRSCCSAGSTARPSRTVGRRPGTFARATSIYV